MVAHEIMKKLNQLDKNWIYRFRSASVLSLKELMYNEIYFSTPGELNDPLDLGAELVIEKDSSYVYEYFLLYALDSAIYPRNQRDSKEAKDLAKRLSKKYSRTRKMGGGA